MTAASYVPAFHGSRDWKTRSGIPSAVAILVGKHGIGNTQQYERGAAIARQTHHPTFPVIPVLMPGCDSPPTGFLQLLTWIDLSKGTNILQQTDSLANLRAALRGEPIAASSIRASICPYRGLEPFREEDAAFFCGRDEPIRELVTRVQAHSFVAIVGPSGSGKSSLVFAGLLPALRQQCQTTMWDAVTLRPGTVAVACASRRVRNRAGTRPRSDRQLSRKRSMRPIAPANADMLASSSNVGLMRPRKSRIAY